MSGTRDTFGGRKKEIPRILSILAAATFSIALAASTFAQNGGDTIETQHWTKPDGTQVTLKAKRGGANLNSAELRAFQNAENADPSVANELGKNPNLIASQGYVNQHPAIQDFLKQYPNGGGDIQQNPGNFLVPTHGSTWNTSVVGKTALSGSD